VSHSAPMLELYLAEALGVLARSESVERSELTEAEAELARATLIELRVEAEPVPLGSWEALAQELQAEADADLSRPKVTLSCTFCHDSLVRQAAVYCATCLAPHHEACFGEHGRCCILGCEETQVVRAGAIDTPLIQATPKRRGFPRWAAVAASLLLLIGGLSFSLTKVTRYVEPTESVHTAVAKTHVGGSTLLEVTWLPADRPVKPGNIDWENLSGEPDDERLLAFDAVAKVEWVMPRLERSLFLIQGVGEGTTSFKIFYPTSNRLVTYRIEVEGEDPHLVARDQRRAELSTKSPRELALKLRDAFRAGQAFAKGRTLPQKESYYRKGYEAVGEALDAAEALAAAEGRRGGRTRASNDWVKKCEQAEIRAQEEWEARLTRELARYRGLVADQAGTTPERRAQLRSVLRLLDHPCDARYRRLEIVLREAYGSSLAERASCPHEGR